MVAFTDYYNAFLMLSVNMVHQKSLCVFLVSLVAQQDFELMMFGGSSSNFCDYEDF